ncbi:MAG: glycoside hydrolase family 5 protein [Muribaculaceae bacterium]|nr:glycoside hydrolase family 5 protein [Muribaculaceae bacterium]
MKIRSLSAVALVLVLVGLSACGKSSKSTAEAVAEDTVVTSLSPLHVAGTALLNASGDTVVLTGPSLGWHSNWGRFYNEGTVKALKEKWGANVTRAAIGAHGSGDCMKTYDADSAYSVNCAMAVIDAAIANDMYVICDWHSHENTLESAKKFFSVITEKYGDSPNVLYEIWNEPLDISWQEIKDYSNELIPLIRKNAPNAVVIVGTPRWDQEVDVAAESPLEMPNLLYSLHYYAGTHKDWNRDKAEKAIAAGLPLIISECGSMDHTGDGPIDYESWEAWMDFADKHNLSVIMWDIADKNETCSMVKPTASDNGMEWTDDDLKEWAKLAQKTIKGRNSKQ